MSINKLRKLLKEMDSEPELVLQVLMEQGWIDNQGVVALDLQGMLDDVSEKAYEDPLATDDLNDALEV